VVQGTLTGPVVKLLGERGAAIFGLAASAISAVGFGLAPGLVVVLVMLVVHSPEGFINSAMTAILSHAAPPDAQGELQGGLASLQSLDMLIATVFYTQVFSYFMRPDAPFVSPGVGMSICAAVLVLVTLGVLFAT